MGNEGVLRKQATTIIKGKGRSRLKTVIGEASLERTKKNERKKQKTPASLPVDESSKGQVPMVGEGVPV
jgi:hypothetical protein